MITYYLNHFRNGKTVTLTSSDDWDKLERWCLVLQKTFKTPHVFIADEPRGGLWKDWEHKKKKLFPHGL